MDLDFEIDCPECGVPIKTSVKAVSQQKTVRCRRGHAVRLVDEGHGMRKAEKAMDDLDRTLRKLGNP